MNDFFSAKLLKKIFTHAENYNTHSIYQEISNRLYQRLQIFKDQSGNILAGEWSKNNNFLVGYNNKNIIASYDFLNFTQNQFPENSFDIIIVNQLLHWHAKPDELVRIWRRWLKPNGVLLFSTLGVNSFKEMQHAFYDDVMPHIHPFFVAEEVASMLTANEFVDVVVDVDPVTVWYQNLTALLTELKQLNLTNISVHRRKTLTGKTRWRNFCERYQQFANAQRKIPVSLELIFVHAVKSLQLRHKKMGEFSIPIDKIRR